MICVRDIREYDDTLNKRLLMSKVDFLECKDTQSFYTLCDDI